MITFRKTIKFNFQQENNTQNDCILVINLQLSMYGIYSYTFFFVSLSLGRIHYNQIIRFHL